MTLRSEDIDKILADDHVVTPSPGFVTTVMQAIEQGLAVRNPGNFPWRRLAPGYLVVLFTIIVGVWNSRDAFLFPTELTGQLASFAMTSGLAWLLLAAAITFLALMIPTALMRGRSYV